MNAPTGWQESPRIIFGTLCEGECRVPPAIRRHLVGRVAGAILLPFGVERRSLKNTVACLQLMDIAGLVVEGELQRAIARHLPQLDTAAQRSQTVDVIARRGKRFTGCSATGTAAAQWCGRGRDGRTALLCGEADELPPIAGTLLAQGWRVLHHAGRRGRRRALPRGVGRITRLDALPHPLDLVVVGTLPRATERRALGRLCNETPPKRIIDLQSGPHRVRGKGAHRLNRKGFSNLVAQVAVDLLTAGLTR